MAFGTAEERLLLACIQCSLDVVPLVCLAELAGEVGDWPRFLELASDHCLQPLAADHLIRSGAAIPAEVSATLERVLSDNARRVFLLSNELLRLMRLLEEAGIPAVALKGPVVAKACYAEPAHRMIGDLDLLISLSDVESALQVLEQAGYQDDGNAHLRACRKAFRRWNNEHALHHPVHRFSVDLHWDFSEAGCVAELNPAELMKRARTEIVEGIAVASLAPRDNLVFLCAHAVKHEWSSLHWLVDICGLVRWSDALGGERARGTETITWVGLLLANFVLEGRVPELARLCQAAPHSSRIWSEGILARFASGGYAMEKLTERLRFLYGMSGGPMLWARAVLSQIAIPREADWASVRIPSSRLFFLYYPWRIARLSRKWLSA